jgi:hypothetical protein
MLDPLQAQTGPARREAEMLASLGDTPYADIWLTAGEQSFGRGLVQAKPDAGIREETLRDLPGQIDYDEALNRFHSTVRAWSRWEQRANERYASPDRERTLDAYAGALLSAVANRHALVTGDRQLLGERTDNAWRDVNILDVREAIALVGLLMRQRGRCGLYRDWNGSVEPPPASYLYGELTSTLTAHQQGELLDVADVAGQLSDPSIDVMHSAEDRVNDLLVSRDEVRIASLLPHGGRMLSPALYHLRAAVQTAAALVDSLAVLACGQLKIPADPLTVTFRRPDFRRALRDASASRFHIVVSSQRFLSLAFCVNEFRGPIGHTGGVRGVTDITAPTVTSYLRISDAQAEKLKQAYGQRRERADDWGAQAGDPSLLDIDVFVDKMTRAVIEAFDEAVTALIEDLRRQYAGPSRLTQAWQEGQARLAEYRARMPAPERDAIQHAEAAQTRAELGDLQETLRELTLYAGLADRPLLERLTTARTAA